LAHDLSGLYDFAGVPGRAAAPEPPDPFITIAALAGSVRANMDFGIAVTDFIRRKSPDLARASHSLSELLNKPLNIGFGSGESINLVPLGYGEIEKPVSLMKEELQRFVQIRDRGLYTTSGSETRLGYDSNPGRIWIGGQRDRMLRITAQYADGWLPAWKMEAVEYADKVVALKQQSQLYGRTPPTMGMFAILIVGDSREQLRSTISANPLLKAAALMASGESWKKYGLSHPAGSDTKGLPNALLHNITPSELYQTLCAAPNELVEEVLFLGSPEEILNQLRPYREAGLEHLLLSFPDAAAMKSGYQVDDFEAKIKAVWDQLRQW